MDKFWQIIHRFKQWIIEIASSGEYRITNPDEENRLCYFMIQSGRYGEPLYVAEPSLGFPAPTGVNYVNLAGEAVSPGRITGIVVMGSDGNLLYRLSLTNARKKGIEWELTEDGKVTIREGDRSTKAYLMAIWRGDKNREERGDAFFAVSPPWKDTNVLVVELADLSTIIYNTMSRE